MVTRYQLRCIANTFPFLRLPAELRNIIYGLCFDVHNIENVLDRYYQKLAKAKHIRNVPGPFVFFHTPNILLVNRQIYLEAKPLLHIQSITFDHGLLDLVSITDFAEEPLFRNLGTITITDTGHKLLGDMKLLATSWVGYIDLIKEMARILSAGHKLKKLKIEFTDPDLVVHMTSCWSGDWECGFRESLRQALNSLRKVSASLFELESNSLTS